MSSENFEHVIPIGGTCNVTLLMQNLKIKTTTTLFEWFISNKLNYITDVLIKIINNEDKDIIKYNGTHMYISDHIYSGHYNNVENFKSIYERRRKRLLDLIVNNNKILFIRFEGTHNLYTCKEIDDFINVIKIINPKIDIKILLISPNKIKLKHDSLITKFYDKHSEDPFCKSKEINELFMNSLIEIGYNFKNKIETIFDDTH